MDEVVCITKDCLNKVDYLDTDENIWYCEKWAHTVSNPYGWTRILDASCIDLIISQCKRLVDRIKLYFNDEEQQLAIWSKYLEQLQSFEDEASEIKDELENSIKNNNLKNQVLMQHRSIDLKYRIWGLESIFSILQS